MEIISIIISKQASFPQSAKTLGKINHIFPFAELEDKRVLLEQMDEVKLILAWLCNLDCFNVKEDRLVLIYIASHNVQHIFLNLLLVIFCEVERISFLPGFLEFGRFYKKE